MFLSQLMRGINACVGNAGLGASRSESDIGRLGSGGMAVQAGLGSGGIVSSADDVCATPSKRLCKRSLLDGMDFATPPKARAAKASTASTPNGIFSGDERRGERKAEHMRLCKKLKLLHSREGLTEDMQAVAHFFNAGKLLQGDRLPGGTLGCGEQRVDKKFNLDACALHTWKSLGKRSFDRNGVEGTHHGLEITSCLASAAARTQQQWLSEQVEHIAQHKYVPVLQRHWDATSNRLAFGSLQDVLAPHARYSMKDAAGNWSLVNYREFKKKYKVARYGVVELLAQGGTIHWWTGQDEIDGCRWVLPPCVIQNGGSSCLFRAVQYSVEPLTPVGLRHLCSRVPFMFVHDHPDGCAPNKRAMAAGKETLPSNCFDISDGTCASHQCWRIAHKAFGKVIGDMHACHVTCGNVAFSGKLQVALRTVIDSPGGHRWELGPPDPQWRKQNELIVLRTLLKQDRFVAAENSFGDSDQAALDAAPLAGRLLDHLNGPWCSDQFQHWCSGCCSSAQEARDKTYGLLSEAGILMEDETKTPCLDNWETAGRCSSRFSFGVLCCSCLPRCVAVAFESWQSSTAPASNGNDDNDERKKIQKKAWRTRCVLASQTRQADIVLMNFLGMPLEHLVVQLDSNDEKGHAITDMLLPDTSPITSAMSEIFRLHSSGEDGPLSPVFRHFHGIRQDIDARADYMALEFSSQLWWRMRKYRCLPYALFGMHHPCIADEDQLGLAESVFGSSCCVPPHSAQKMAKHWPDARSLKADERLKGSLKVASRTIRLTDMRSERILARCTTSVDGHAVEVEKVSARTFLDIARADHVQRLGRKDPRFVTRADLLAAGVPIAAQAAHKRKEAKENHGPQKQPGLFFAYLARRCEERKALSPLLLDDHGERTGGEQEYKDYVRSIAKDFKLIDDAEYTALLAEVRSRHIVKRLDFEKPPPAPAYDRVGINRTYVSDLGTHDSPFPVDLWRKQIEKSCGLTQDAELPGMTKCAAPLRESFCASLFVKDSGDVPPEKEFSQTLICPLAHPGLCATRDAKDLDVIRPVIKRFQMFLEGVKVGQVLAIQFHYEDVEQPFTKFVKFAHFRGSGPRVALFALVAFEGGQCKYVIREHDGVGAHLLHELDYTVVGMPMRGCVVSRVSVAVVPAVRASAICCDVDVATSLTFHDLHPYCYLQRSVGATKPEAVRRLLQGLEGCADGRAKIARHNAMRLRYPRSTEPRASGREDSDCTLDGSVSSGEASAPSEDEVSDAEDDRRDAWGIGLPIPLPSVSRKIKWGPFFIAPIYSKCGNEDGRRTHQGWGATCNRHFDRVGQRGCDAICKKQLRGNDAATRRLVCYWLLLGVSSTTRRGHIDVQAAV